MIQIRRKKVQDWWCRRFVHVNFFRTVVVFAVWVKDEKCDVHHVCHHHQLHLHTRKATDLIIILLLNADQDIVTKHPRGLPGKELKNSRGVEKRYYHKPVTEVGAAPLNEEYWSSELPISLNCSSALLRKSHCRIVHFGCFRSILCMFK